MNTFYMVFVEGCATPACKHDSLDSAEKEAKRLATLLKKKAYVLCTIKSVEDTQYKIEDCRPGESDLPFKFIWKCKNINSPIIGGFQKPNSRKIKAKYSLALRVVVALQWVTS